MNTNKEVISIQIGQAGVQIGEKVWELYNIEHGIDATGEKKTPIHEDEKINSFYTQGENSGKFRPKTVYIDLEQSTINKLGMENLKISTAQIPSILEALVQTELMQKEVDQ